MSRNQSEITTKSTESHGAPRSKTRYVLNVRLFVVSLIVVAVVGGGGYAWFRYQVDRTATSFLARSDELEKSKDFRRAIKYVNRFIALHRGSDEATAAEVRLAHLSDELAKSDSNAKPQAVRALYRAIGVASDAEARELQSRLVQLLLETGRFAEAETEALAILAVSATDSAAMRVHALALYYQVNRGALTGSRDGNVSVGETLEQALRANPGDIQLSWALAQIFRRYPHLLSDFQKKSHSTPEIKNLEADAIVDAVVKSAADNPEAWLLRYRYRKSFELADSNADLEMAVAKGPDDLDVRLSAAAEAQSQKDPVKQQRAVEHYEYILTKIDAKNEVAWVNLGQYFAVNNDIEKALLTWRNALRELGDGNWEVNVRMAAALIDVERWEEADKWIKVVEGLAERTVSASNAAVAAGISRARADSRDLLRASWFVRRGEKLGDPALVQKAIPRLERLRQKAKPRPEPLMLLGACYQALRQSDAAAKVFDEVVKLDSKDIPARVAAASAWLSAGQLGEAEQRYASLVVASDRGDNWLGLANVRLQQQAKLQPAQRNWGTFSAALARAQAFADKNELADPWQIALLKADQLEMTLKPSGAAAPRPDSKDKSQKPAASEWQEKVLVLLRDAERAYPDAQQLLQRLVLAYDRLGDSPGADRALARLEQIAASPHVVLLLRARLQTNRNQLSEAEATLKSGLSDERPFVRAEIQTSLAKLKLAQGKPDEAKILLLKQSDQSTADVGALYQLAEMLLNEQKFSEAEKHEARLKELEGPAGTLWRLIQARRLMAQAKEKNDKQDANLQEAGRLLKAVVNSRPKWSVAHRMSGVLADQLGDVPGAVAAYGRAVEFGDRTPQVLQRLFLLLNDNMAESERFLAMIGDPGAISSEIAGTEISLAQRRGQRDEAVKLAQAEVQRHPQSARSHYWLGRILLNYFDPNASNAEAVRAEAFQALKTAMELEPKNPQIWSGVYVYHIRTGEPEQARAMIDQVEQFTDVIPAKRLVFKAQCYLLLNERQTAQELFEQAAKLDPTNAEYHLHLANLHMRDNVPLATEHLRSAFKINPKSDLVRRGLAAVLLAQGGSDNWADAEQLLESTDSRPSNDADLLMQAEALMIRKGPENLKKARTILEQLKKGRPETSKIQMLLAQAYELLSLDSQARGEYRAAAARENATPNQILAFADYLLRHEQWNDAEPWMKQFETKQPNSLVALQLRTRWLHGLGRDLEIDPVIEEFAKENGSSLKDASGRARFHVALGDLCTQSGRFELAERWYRQAVELSPSNFSGLAFALARLKRNAEAIEVCCVAAAAETVKTTQPAIVACEVLLLAPANQDGLQHAEPLLLESLSSFPDDPKLLGSIANLRFFQQRLDEALVLYRKVVTLTPTDAVALNNLATALGEQPGRGEEALRYAEKALSQGGEQPPLLDTKGTILIHLGRFEQAIPVLETASRSLKPDPRFLFHLAVAYGRKGQLKKAQSVLKAAQGKGLQAQVLTAGDRRLLDELELQLEGVGAT